MLLGFLNYLVGSQDTDGATRMYNYLKNHNYQLCPTASDNRCDVSPIPYIAGWGTMGQLFKHLGLPETSEMTNAQIFGVDQASINLESDFAAEGFPLHLVAVELRLRQLTNNFTSALQQAANNVLQRQPNNPFYEYVAHGKTTRAAQLALDKCPHNKPAHADQWAWQRDETEQAWLESCGWDCIFVMNLLTE
jgi:hypothetical protein